MYGGKTTEWICRSNDHPNLHYCVQQMGHSKESCHDLAFLVLLGLKESDDMPMPFVVTHETMENKVLDS